MKLKPKARRQILVEQVRRAKDEKRDWPWWLAYSTRVDAALAAKEIGR